MIQYIAEGVELPDLKKRKINNWIRQVALEYDRRLGDIAYVFCNDEKILEINRQYLSHDYFTDIITFDYSEGNLISGDIFISIDTVRFNAQELDVQFLNELHRIIIHGILHLCGQDDKTPELRIQMTSKENKALSELNEMH